MKYIFFHINIDIISHKSDVFPHPRTCSKCDFKLYEKDFYETTILFTKKTYILFFPFTRMIHFFLDMKL